MNYKVLAKYGQSVAFGVGALLVIVFFLINLAAGLDAALNFFIWAGIVFFILTLVALVGFALYQILIDPKGSAKGLMGIGALFLVFVILFFAFPAETGGKLAALREANNISDNLMKGLSSGIYTTAILFVAGFCAFLYSEVRNLFK
jgi:hypothetical protein